MYYEIIKHVIVTVCCIIDNKIVINIIIKPRLFCDLIKAFVDIWIWIERNLSALTRLGLKTQCPSKIFGQWYTSEGWGNLCKEIRPRSREQDVLK